MLKINIFREIRIEHHFLLLFIFSFFVQLKEKCVETKKNCVKLKKKIVWYGGVEVTTMRLILRRNGSSCLLKSSSLTGGREGGGEGV